MTKYSYSRINQFDNCPFAYNLHYNEGYDSPYETIEAFAGKRVHEALERLYTDLENDKVDTLDEILGFYHTRWDSEYNEYVINSSDYSEDEQRDMGAECIERYYRRFEPFDDIHIAGLETEELMDLPDGNSWYVRIDKFGFRDGMFYVCDYKTGNRMKSQYDADTDIQLAMYGLWVKKRYGMDKRVILVWHMLKFDKDVISERSNMDLDNTERRVLSKIKEIESCTEWKPIRSPLCRWCVYQHKCPLFGDHSA